MSLLHRNLLAQAWAAAEPLFMEAMKGAATIAAPELAPVVDPLIDVAAQALAPSPAPASPSPVSPPAATAAATVASAAPASSPAPSAPAAAAAAVSAAIDAHVSGAPVPAVDLTAGPQAAALAAFQALSTQVANLVTQMNAIAANIGIKA
ncbi:MAG TPA: hypothetical protein VFA39_19030 [Steroidobacteraceae bacterium]|nr:hypothetical protein [Steroidobacteraceae bacterium]